MARPDKLILAAVSALVLAGLAAPAFAQATGEPLASRDPRVKFRDGARLLADLSDGLEIPRDEICRELSKYDCNDEAFLIVLGGVDPYEVRVLEPLEHASLASPIAFDRVALQVCVNRVDRDIAAPASAVLFRAPARTADRAWMEATTTSIYDRLLQREPTAEEKARMAAFYTTVAEGRRDPAQAIQKDWVVLSCFAVASSLESAFY